MKKQTLKRALSCLLVLIMLLGLVPALNISAAEVKVAESTADAPIAEVEADVPVAEVSDVTDEGITYKIKDGEITITGTKYDVYSSRVFVIPSEIDGCPVTTIENIGSLWAYNIILPDTISRIEDNAFWGCRVLKEITIPASVTYLGVEAFAYCELLESVVLNNPSIEQYAFRDCTKLTRVTITSSVKSIGYCAFAGCTALESITIPSSVEHIDGNIFLGCNSLNIINVDEKNTVYDSRNNCNAIIETATSTLTNGCKGSVIPTGVTVIGDSAFSECVGLKIINIPDSVERINANAFEGCDSLKSVDMSNASLTYMGNDVFMGCKKLESLTIPEGVTEIWPRSFMYCEKLKSISIPSTVTGIDDSAFHNCDSLEKIVVSKDNPRYDSRDNCNAIIFTSTDMLLLGCSGTVIPSSVKEIGHDAFIGGDLFTKISIPSGVEKISERAFCRCESLSNIEISNTVTSIGSEAFLNTAYYNDESNWDNGVLYIDSALIDAKDELSGTYKIKEGTTVVASSAFNQCKNLESISIPDSIIALPSSWVAFCDSLKEIKVSKNNIVYDSRNDCNAVIKTKENMLVTGCKETVIPSDIERIGYAAFFGCYELESITIPSSVSIIDMYAFYYCKNLISVSIEEGLTAIDAWAFDNCSSLKNIIIPSSVTEISWATFKNCPVSLTIHGYAGSYAETYAIEYGIDFVSLEQLQICSMRVYSDRSGLSVNVGENIRIGVGVLKDGDELLDASKVTFSIGDSSIIKPVDSIVKENLYFAEFEGLKAGSTYVTFSDSDTGCTCKVPVFVSDRDACTFTLSSIEKYTNGKYLTEVANISGIYADNYNYSVNENTGVAHVTFDAYNTSYSYGAVDVYDGEGNIVEAVVLDKCPQNASSLKGIFVDNPFYLYGDIMSGDILPENSYRAQINSKKTSVSINIPKNGYITITTDLQSSPTVAFANGIDITFGIKEIAGDLTGFGTDSSKFVKKTTEQMIDHIIKENLKPESVAKKLYKGISKETMMTTKYMGNFADNFVASLAELDMKEFIISSAADFAWGVGEEVAIALTGGYKVVFDGLLVVGKVTELGNQYLDLASNMEGGTITIQNQTGSKRVSEDVTVECETSFDNEVALKVFNVVPEAQLLEDIKDKAPALYDAMMNDLSQVYNISMIKNGEETQPHDKVKVYIPISSELLPFTGMGTVKIYRVEEDGSVTDMNAKVDGNFMVFTTDHFSLYVLAVEKNEPVIPVGILGDANGDEKVNVKDATLIQKFGASLEELDDVQLKLADINFDTKVNVKDATAIQKYAASIETGYPIGEPII